jgi:hypothetical protein
MIISNLIEPDYYNFSTRIRHKISVKSFSDVRIPGKYFGGARRLVVSLAGKPLKFGISDPAEEKFTILYLFVNQKPTLSSPNPATASTLCAYRPRETFEKRVVKQSWRQKHCKLLSDPVNKFADLR